MAALIPTLRFKIGSWSIEVDALQKDGKTIQFVLKAAILSLRETQHLPQLTKTLQSCSPSSQIITMADRSSTNQAAQGSVLDRRVVKLFYNMFRNMVKPRVELTPYSRKNDAHLCACLHLHVCLDGGQFLSIFVCCVLPV